MPGHIDVKTTRVAFGRADVVDWADLGNEGVVVAIGSNCGTSRQGLRYTVHNPPRCLRVDQGRQRRWPGNFRNGEALLYTWKRVGPLTILFDHVVRGVGAQIQERFGISKPGGAPFVAVIRAFDANHDPIVPNELTPAILQGRSDDSADGSAIFIGLLCDQALIQSVEFATQALDPADLDGDFAINWLSIVH